MSKIMYLHGLEGNANGTKGSYCQTHFQAIAPQMPASITDRAHIHTCFEDCYQVARTAVEVHQPTLIIGSSFGGWITASLMQRGAYKGKAILLAPAGIKYGMSPQLPSGNQVIIIHAPDDDIVSFSDSVQIIQANPDQVQLWSVSGGHRLHNLTQTKQLKHAVDFMQKEA